MALKPKATGKKVITRHSSQPRIYEGLPVVDATDKLYIQVTQEDIENATAGDPCDCMYARCIKRVYDSEKVFIFSSTAYVQMLDKKGKKVLKRYRLSSGLAQERLNFDLGKPVQARGLTFNPPTPSHQLINRKEKGWHERKEEGYKKPDPNRPGVKKREKPAEGTLISRSGMGMVKFRAKDDHNTIKSRYIPEPKALPAPAKSGRGRAMLAKQRADFKKKSA